MTDLCPYCGSVNDDFTAVEPGTVPTAGAVSVCATCLGLTVYTGDGLAVRLPTDAERAEIEGDPRISRITDAVRHAHRAVRSARQHSRRGLS